MPQTTAESSNLCKQPTCIEDLPEEVLSIIMSKFSLKEGVRASLTCKRWLSLPTWLSEITFDTQTMTSGRTELGEDDKDIFVKRVNRFLERYGKPGSRRMPLSAFRIRFCLGRDSATHINSWIGFALSNGVRVLDVVLWPDYELKGYCCTKPIDEIHVFPCDLLNKPHIVLEKLWLVSCVFGRSLNTKLTSLKELAFWSTDVAKVDMRNIITYCTSLTEISFDFCALPSKLIVGGNSLAFLKVRWCRFVRKIELSDGRALTHFMYHGLHIKFINFCNAPKLSDVNFCMHSYDPSLDDEYVSEVLHLDFPVIKNLVHARFRDTLPSLSFQADAFCRLEVLKLLYAPHVTFSLLSVLKLLRACPVLRSFEMVPPFRCEGGKDVNVRLPIQAFHNSLKIVEIREFTCSKDELKLVSMIIQASTGLDQATVVCVRKNRKEFEGIQKMKLAKSTFLKLMQGGTLIFL